MAGLVPAIHVDARHKAGHDEKQGRFNVIGIGSKLQSLNLLLRVGKRVPSIPRSGLVQYFVADIAAFPGIAMAWAARYRRPPHPFVCVATPPEMPDPGAALIADFWIAAAA
jgi:hypothetical protein